jgi:hypothetical protein
MKCITSFFALCVLIPECIMLCCRPGGLLGYEVHHIVFCALRACS